VCVQNRKERLYFLCLCVLKVLNEFSKKHSYQHVAHRRKNGNKQESSYTATDINSRHAALPSRFPDVQREGSARFRSKTKRTGLTNYESTFIILNSEEEHTLSL
jgi:hypothetical protein